MKKPLDVKVSGDKVRAMRCGLGGEESGKAGSHQANRLRVPAQGGTPRHRRIGWVEVRGGHLT